MRTKIILHVHNHGTSVAVFTCDFDTNQLSDAETLKLAEICGLDFEPELGEDLDIIDVTETISHITKDLLQ